MSDTKPLSSASTSSPSNAPPPCATSAPQDEPRALSEVEARTLEKLKIKKHDYFEWIKKIEGGDLDALYAPIIKSRGFNNGAELLRVAAPFLKLEKLCLKIRSTDKIEVHRALGILRWAEENGNPEAEKIVNSVDLTYWFQTANRDFREPGVEDALSILADFKSARHLKAQQLKEASYGYKSEAADYEDMLRRRGTFSILKPAFEFESFQANGGGGYSSKGNAVGLVSVGPVFGFDKGKNISSIQVPLVIKYSRWNSENIIGGETGLRFNLPEKSHEFPIWSLSTLVGLGALSGEGHSTTLGIIPALRLGLGTNILNLESGIMAYSNSETVKPGQFYFGFTFDFGELLGSGIGEGG